MKKETIRITLHLEKELWDKMVFNYGEDHYVPVTHREFSVKGMITIRHAQLIHQRKAYGHSGFWIDPERALAQRHVCYRSKNIQVDASLRKVFVQEDEVQLRPSDFDLLIHFMENPHRVILRRSLIDMLESRHRHEIQDNTLSVHIQRIRKAIKNKAILRTISMVGYEWTEDVIVDKQAL